MSFSKDPKLVLQDATSKGYSRVRFQQGKLVLDRELNLLGDLANPQRIAEPYIGSGVPAGSDGFLISNLAPNDFTIVAGRCLVDGAEAVLRTNTTYKTQPHKEKAVAFPAAPAFGVYLRVFPSQITEVDDADLKNPGDVGAVTALREKTDWEVVVSVASPGADHYQLATINTAAKQITDTRRTGLTVETLRDDVNADRDLIKKMSDRVDAILAANGTLRANSVAGPQIVSKSVDSDKLADNAVPISKLSAAVLLVDKEVGMGPTVGADKGQLIIPIEATEKHAFYLASVRQVESAIQKRQLATFTWSFGNQIIKGAAPGQLVQQNVLVVQNLSAEFGLRIMCKIYRVSET